MVDKTTNMPIWVYLAFSSIHSRTGARWLIAASCIFTAYCIPWSLLFASPGWLGNLFLIHDWNWFAMMVPVTLWYWLSLRWLDAHAGWV